ncbi:hypothetical protein C8R44DRAFT_862738, partial [Mycena epipterygia]
WGLRDRVRTPLECAAVPAATARVPSPNTSGPTLAYKPRALPGLPPLPLSAVQHAALPLLQAFPSVGGRANLSLGHAASAEAGLLGTRGSVSSSGQGAGQGGHGLSSPPGARADAATPTLFPRRPPDRSTRQGPLLVHPLPRPLPPHARALSRAACAVAPTTGRRGRAPVVERVAQSGPPRVARAHAEA